MSENQTETAEEDVIDPALEAERERQSIAMFTTMRDSLARYAEHEAASNKK